MKKIRNHEFRYFMSFAILIATFFSIGFFIESMVGFGGAIIAYSLLGFFVDIKAMVIAGLYIGTCSSCYILYTDYKSFNKDIFLRSVPICLIGTFIGVFIFSNANSQTLGLILGGLLIILSLRILFFDKVILPKLFKNKLLVIGGISHGAFGIGGPFFVNALHDSFKNKSELRTTVALFFIFFNIVRVIQLSYQYQIDWSFMSDIWWVMIPIWMSIYLGFKAHLKVNEKLVKQIIALVTMLGGLRFLSSIM